MVLPGLVLVQVLEQEQAPGRVLELMTEQVHLLAKETVLVWGAQVCILGQKVQPTSARARTS